MSTRNSKRIGKNKKNLKYIIFVISTLLLVGVISFGVNLILETKKATTKMFEPLIRDEDVQSDKPELKTTPFSLLVAGIDENKGETYGRSDMLLLVTVHPNLGKISMVNIPRDTRVYVEELEREDKVNHTYSNGGIDYTINALEKLLEIPIDFYVSTNFQGFEDIVDTLGGIEVDVPFTVNIQMADTLEWKTYIEGPMVLKGNEALAYVRMRKKDPEGDIGRNKRQKQVIQEILNESTSFSSISKLDDLIKNVGDNVKTNISTSDYWSFIQLSQQLKGSPIDQLTLEGYDERIYSKTEGKELWFFIPNEDSLEQLKSSLQTNLGKETPKNIPPSNINLTLYNK
ncbi:LCP family protein [Psychrobacillus antarcticus]|uniref:LCP family protein n=1 Tax=Psychrobacillus antarcticus TaxID=2879115 RepID=UPI002407D5C3|nr:LCP family protein [Psychrobacillus antarcticus]